MTIRVLIFSKISNQFTTIVGAIYSTIIAQKHTLRWVLWCQTAQSGGDDDVVLGGVVVSGDSGGVMGNIIGFSVVCR